MKYVIRAGAVLLLLCIAAAFGVFLYLQPSDVVMSNYRSLEAARADRLFDRGWLPDILPPSAHSIRTSNNLDLNTSEGQFSFSASEYPSFAAQLQPYRPVVAPFVAFDEGVTKMKHKGFQPLIYEVDGTVWVFFCKPGNGYCEYDMWLRRG